MTIGDFAEAAAQLRRMYGASETSAGRTDARSIAKHGFAGDPHNWDRGRDWVYGSGPNRPGSAGHVRAPRHCRDCSTEDLRLIHEETHDHVQAADFPAGPVTVYAGEVKTWT
jgi:hypothetical protein